MQSFPEYSDGEGQSQGCTPVTCQRNISKQIICMSFSNFNYVKISAVAALILIYSELSVHPQAGFGLTRSSGLLDLEMELGSLYERIIIDVSSEIIFFF